MASFLFVQVLTTLLLQHPEVDGVLLGWISSPMIARRVVDGSSSILSARRGGRTTLRKSNGCSDAATVVSLESYQHFVGEWERRDFLQAATTSSAAVLLLVPNTAAAALAVPTLPSPPRLVNVGQGGGTDISIDTQSKILSDPDNIVFPASLQGRWSCVRTCVSVQGDAYQAQSAWKAMLGGGGGGINSRFGPKTVPEQYEIQFIPAPFQPEKYTVLDRSYELQSRSSSVGGGLPEVVVQWSPQEPNNARVGTSTELAVIQRNAIVPNLEQGGTIVVGGGQELIRISSVSGGDPIVRAVLVKQRFRIAAAASDADTTDAADAGANSQQTSITLVELVQTFRVLDGIAGTEFPTSTTMYSLTLVKLGPLVNNNTTVEEEEDSSTEELVSSSSLSLYFDGSTWY
jgi:hypothetical protein